MNLGNPQLELIDPTPNVHNLFLHFDIMFFWAKLYSRAVVRWSKRMYSSAGICSCKGNGALCHINLSEPLLKLRPRKDLVETLLHEMIHAYLFTTNGGRDNDGHGPNFQTHMYRINNSAGLNISIRHDFHDEVKLYQTHWWRCNGPCQTQKPYFGIIRKTVNRLPGPRDIWFEQHKRSCGGTFIKIKKPEKQGKKVTPKNATTKKPNADIINFVTSNKKTTIGDYDLPNEGILKDSNNIPVRANSNSSHNVEVSKKGVVYNPQPVEVPTFNDAGKIIGDPIDNRRQSVGVMETVKNVWANKQIPPAPTQVNNNMPTLKSATSNIIIGNRNKRKADNVHIDSPPSKLKKIDDYFKNDEMVLKKLYGQDLDVRMSTDNEKNLARPVKGPTVKVKQEDLADCPVCSEKVKSAEINRHLDKRLNKEVISSLCNDNETVTHLHNIKTEILNGIKKQLGRSNSFTFRIKDKQDNRNVNVKVEPSTSKALVPEKADHICPCCDKKVDKTIDEHLDECLAFFDNNTTIPEEGSSTSYADLTVIEIDYDHDIFDETLTLNATGTKCPCPCCLEMVEQAEMNEHLDSCLS